MRRQRNAKIVSTLGPASSTVDVIEALYREGTDVFRMNLSHGTHEDHRQRYEIIRDLEKKYQRPIGIILDLQGPKLRVGVVEEGVVLNAGDVLDFDLQEGIGTKSRVTFPHKEIYPSITPGTDLLIDDGKIRLKVISSSSEKISAKVIIGGPLSSRKGVNIPTALLPLPALTEKDLIDLQFGLDLGVDWIALSFVQRPEDVQQLIDILKGRARIITKIEKPQAVQQLESIIRLSDAVMVARGDLGVELPTEEVPCVQKQILKIGRQLGKPVIVATQMLDSMINNPSPTRAEASDVATAIFDGADGVMLSAESSAGNYPVESVQMMNRIIQRVESDNFYHQVKSSNRPDPLPTTTDAIMAAAQRIAQTIPIAVIVAFTESGHTALMAARERPASPILGLTPNPLTARALSLAWGIHAAIIPEISTFSEMVHDGVKAAATNGFAERGEQVIVTAGVPFGISGATNIIRIAHVTDEVLGEIS